MTGARRPAWWENMECRVGQNGHTGQLSLDGVMAIETVSRLLFVLLFLQHVVGSLTGTNAMVGEGNS